MRIMIDPSHDIDHLRSEGDINISPLRQKWSLYHIDEETQKVLQEDNEVFLHQSLSTPCLNVLEKCEASYIIDTRGRRLLDFHGNNVHQLGFSHSKVIAAIEQQMASLSFCTRRYTNQVAIDLARKLVSLTPGDLNRVLFAPGGTSSH